MAKVVPDDHNAFRRVWGLAKDQGVSRQVVADSLGIDRGRLNDLILGRSRPTLGETAALTGRRRSTLVRYRDVGGGEHGFYTGRGMSYQRLIEERVLEDMADEQAEVNRYLQRAEFTAMTNRYPANPTVTMIHSIRPRHADRVRDMRVKR